MGRFLEKLGLAAAITGAAFGAKAETKKNVEGEKPAAAAQQAGETAPDVVPGFLPMSEDLDTDGSAKVREARPELVVPGFLPPEDYTEADLARMEEAKDINRAILQGSETERLQVQADIETLTKPFIDAGMKEIVAKKGNIDPRVQENMRVAADFVIKDYFKGSIPSQGAREKVESLQKAVEGLKKQDAGPAVQVLEDQLNRMERDVLIITLVKSNDASQNKAELAKIVLERMDVISDFLPPGKN